MLEMIADAELVLAGQRIPLQYRQSKEKARAFYGAVESARNGRGVPSSMLVLARWAGIGPCEAVAKVRSIRELGTLPTYDLSVPDGRSYVINGMVCHNTCNLPENVTAEAVRDLCWHAWETGCKGFTIYRIGSRNAVIKKADDTSNTQQPGSIVEHHAPKRPKELECDIHRTTVQGEKYLVIVGLLDGKPYEVLAGLQEHVEVPARIKKGRLQKNGRKDGVATYNLILPIGDSGDELVLKDVVNLFANLTHGAFTRMISLSLRHGAPVKYLVEQLQKDKNSEIMSFSRCIARVLGKHYIPDGTPATVEKACPKCGSTNLVYQQGCATCYSCGDSKCG